MSEAQDVALFKKLIDENRYNFCKLVYIIFPFGEKGSELATYDPYSWQMEEWAKLLVSSYEMRGSMCKALVQLVGAEAAVESGFIRAELERIGVGTLKEKVKSQFPR